MNTTFEIPIWVQILFFIFGFVILYFASIGLDEYRRRALAKFYRRREIRRGSRITIGSNPEPFTIIDKSGDTITVDRHDPDAKDGDIIAPYEGRW